jgi:hydroxymethylbilane synthase
VAGMSIRIGTRGSLLALTQAQIFADVWLSAFPETGVRIVPVRTTGDRIRDRPLYDLGGKGLFVRELEHALHRGDIDVAVHSLKDMEWDAVSDLVTACVLPRDDPRDVLVSRHGGALADLPAGAVVGTVSGRRRAQILRMRSDLKIVPLRGNVDSRLARLDKGEMDAVVLAGVALKRLGLDARVSAFFSVEEMVPSAGQGVLAIQCRLDQADLVARLRSLDHVETAQCILAERTFVHRLGGDCRSPVGSYAWYEDGKLNLRGFWMDGHTIHEGKLWVRPHDPASAGLTLAEQFLREHERSPVRSHG